MSSLNHTHDPAARSWIDSANDLSTDFPLQNLPYCAFFAKQSQGAVANEAIGCVIGDQVLDMSIAMQHGLLPVLTESARRSSSGVGGGDVNGSGSNDGPDAITRDVLSELNSMQRAQLRIELFDVLHEKAAAQIRDSAKQAIYPLKDVTLIKPAVMRNYTDFYASIHHATAVGSMFRPDNPLLPNYKHIPIGYHGRASSIVLSGELVRRPSGQQSPPDADPTAGPSFGPCKLLDYELEVGCVIAKATNSAPRFQ